MKNLIFLCLLLVTLPVLGQKSNNPGLVAGVKALDAKNGFRAYKLGTPISKILGLVRVISDFNGKQVYSKPGEPMGIGPVHLTSLNFVADKSRLVAIILTCYGAANAENLLSVLQAQYGPGLNDRDEHRTWPGNIATMDYEITDDKCTVMFVSNAASGKADRSAIRRGISDL